jgi:transcriptional antiterminator
MSLITQIRRIERVDQLIRLKATGTATELAKRIGTSKRTVYNIIEFMENEGADIYYNSEKKSFCYKKDLYFYFGFSTERVQLKRIKGGTQNNFLSFFESAKFLHFEGVSLK